MDATKIIRDLVGVASGQTKHVYLGACPDEVEGPDVRDEDCPACQALIAADQAVGKP